MPAPRMNRPEGLRREQAANYIIERLDGSCEPGLKNKLTVWRIVLHTGEVRTGHDLTRPTPESPFYRYCTDGRLADGYVTIPESEVARAEEDKHLTKLARRNWFGYRLTLGHIPDTPERIQGTITRIWPERLLEQAVSNLAGARLAEL